MSSVIEKNDLLLPFPYGTRVKIRRHEVLPSVSYSVTAPRCCELILTFDRAGYNSYDDLYSFCFVSPSGEEHWFELGEQAEIKETFHKLLEIVAE